MICHICNDSFTPHHFNQKLCSDNCKIIRRRRVKTKYKKSKKGIASTKRWQSSMRFKANETIYRQKPLAKKKAVARAMKYQHSTPERLSEKRRVNRIYIYRTQGRLKEWFKDKADIGCVVCRSFNRLCIDHIKPRSLGGSDDIENLQVLCFSCNSKKGNKYAMQEM